MPGGTARRSSGKPLGTRRGNPGGGSPVGPPADGPVGPRGMRFAAAPGGDRLPARGRVATLDDGLVLGRPGNSIRTPPNRRSPTGSVGRAEAVPPQRDRFHSPMAAGRTGPQELTDVSSGGYWGSPCFFLPTPKRRAGAGFGRSYAQLLRRNRARCELARSPNHDRCGCLL